MQKSWCFHLSLNVASIPRAIEFYRALFGMEPAKCHDDYAKFEVVDPPVVFSLVPRAVGSGGTRSQVGLRLASAELADEIRARLESRGIHIHTGVDPDAGFGVSDPDGNAWQLTATDEAPDWAPTEEPAAETDAAPGQPIVWEHYVTAALPERIPHDDATVDEVRLTGSFNGSAPDSARHRLVADALRVLKPGCKVVVHGLAADKPFPGGMPTLPGLAAMVSHVPLHNDVAQALRQAGFTSVQFIKFSDKAWFAHDGVEMREIKAIAWKPLAAANGNMRDVIYRGPFRQIRDDQGNSYPRGVRVAISSATWTMLRQSPQAAQFVFVVSQETGKTCQVH